MGNKIVYKGYNVGETTQVSIMPTATADNSGAIVQFVGTTTANYINGRFYRCVSDGASTPAYAWEEVDFGGGKDIYSTTEIKTNKVWIDGKPIYKKVFTDIPLPEEADIVQADRRTTKKYTSVFPANYISDIVSASFVVINRTHGNQYNLPRIWESSEPDTSESMIVSIDANIISEDETFGYSFEIGSNRTSWNNTNYKVRAIVEYTKIED